jgi:23S rRNA-/tRNA-specific pseudouridylate synthase
MSVTEFTMLERKGELALLALRPITGRTHQLRLHCAHMGYPILGDPQYGNAASQAVSAQLGLKFQQLCARELRFDHPMTGEEMCLQSKIEIQIL